MYPVREQTGRPALGLLTSAMAEAASCFLHGLTTDQRAASQFAFDTPHRTLWEFEPLGAGNPRFGVSWPDLSNHQRHLARELLRTGFSACGVAKLELIREVECIQHPQHRDRSYSLWFYGAPSSDAPWMWRFEGHHVSASFTLRGGAVSHTPLFIGVSPTCVGDNADNPSVPVGTRALAVEDDLSKALYTSLDEKQRSASAIPLPPMMMRTPHVDRVERGTPVGIRVADLRHDQRHLVHLIVHTVLSDLTPELAALRRREVELAGLDATVLSTAPANVRSEPWGHARPGGYYYRLQGQTFLYEFDDVQWGEQESGHIHTIWRDFDRDFGLDATGAPDS